MNRRDILLAALSSAALVPFAGRALAAGTPFKAALGWLPNNAYAGEVIALTKGYFAEAGLDVELIPGGPSANPIQDLMGGAAEVAIGYAPQIMYSVAKGVPLKSFAASYQKAPLSFYSLKEKNINSVADWKGKRVGAAQSGVPQIKAVLAHNGLAFEDITFVQANVPALMQDQVDLVAAWPTNLGQIKPILEHPAGYNVQSIWDNGLQFQSNYYIARNDALASKSAELVAFLQAADKGWAWVADNIDEAAALLAEYAPALNAEAEAASLRVAIPEYIYTDETKTAGFGNVSADRWQATLDTYTKLGEVPAMKASDVHDGSILAAAKRTMR